MAPREPDWWYGGGDRWEPLILAPLGWAYGAMTAWRMQRPPRYHANIPVVCVGNFTSGGTGKTPLVALLVEMLRQQGEAPLEKFLEQLARSLQPMVRQNDMAVKYMSWALAFILPDTSLNGAQSLIEKLRRAATGVRPPWDSTQITLSAAIVEAVTRPEYESEDIVTDLINRAEYSVEEARKRGGDLIVAGDVPA